MERSDPGPVEARVTAWLERAGRLLAPVLASRPILLGDDAALRAEADRIRPEVEAVAGRPYGRLPRIGYRAGFEARVAGPWSQYLTLGFGATRVVRMTSWAASRPAIPTILAHELAHRYTFDESVTTLRGIEVSARLAEREDEAHAVGVRWELARVAIGGAMLAALGTPAEAEIDAFFGRAASAPLARARARWEQVRRTPAARGDWALTVYAAMPLAEIERAATCGAVRSEPFALPEFVRDSAQAWACAGYTRVDAWTGRRRETVPMDALLRLWRSAD